MDTETTKSQQVAGAEVPVNAAKVADNKSSKKEEELSNALLEKDEEIKALKAQVADAKKVNAAKDGDIRARTNSMGDPAMITVGVDAFGRKIFKKATELTEADLKKREDYMQSIKQANARKY